MTDVEILALVSKLEHCEIAPHEFHHCDHLAVSVAYLYALDFPAALEKMRTTLQRFIRHHGLKGYHETITRFWMVQVAKRLDSSLCLSEAVRQIQGEFGNKDLIYQYFSKETLNCAAAERGWVDPDRTVKGS
ncbi:MAG TPA: hypothetical protein VIX19_14060 [Terriglobales bacterium]